MARKIVKKERPHGASVRTTNLQSHLPDTRPCEDLGKVRIHGHQSRYRRTWKGIRMVMPTSLEMSNCHGHCAVAF